VTRKAKGIDLLADWSGDGQGWFLEELETAIGDFETEGQTRTRRLSQKLSLDEANRAWVRVEEPPPPRRPKSESQKRPARRVPVTAVHSSTSAEEGQERPVYSAETRWTTEETGKHGKQEPGDSREGPETREGQARMHRTRGTGKASTRADEEEDWWSRWGTTVVIVGTVTLVVLVWWAWRRRRRLRKAAAGLARTQAQLTPHTLHPSAVLA